MSLGNRCASRCKGQGKREARVTCNGRGACDSCSALSSPFALVFVHNAVLQANQLAPKHELFISGFLLVESSCTLYYIIIHNLMSD